MIARTLRALGYYVYKPVGLPYGVDEVVDVRKLGRPDPVVVFDVGANVGRTAARYAAAWPAVVHAFEPMPANFAQLADVAQGNPRIRAVNRAVGRSPGRLAVIPRESGLNTLTDAVPPGAGTEDRVEVEVITLDRYASDAGVDRIDFLKTDTEGYDIEVLAGAEGLLAGGRVGLVLSEIEFRSRPSGPHTNFFALHEYLGRFGFRLATVYTEAMDADGFFFGSALFVGPVK